MYKTIRPDRPSSVSTAGGDHGTLDSARGVAPQESEVIGGRAQQRSVLCTKASRFRVRQRKSNKVGQWRPTGCDDRIEVLAGRKAIVPPPTLGEIAMAAGARRS